MNISDLTTLATTSSTGTRELPENSIDNNMGKDEFLNILVMQMANQNPLEPTTDTDFIAQLAQFSTLEQMQNMNTSLETTQAYSMVGKTVFVNVQESENAAPEIMSGKVDGVLKLDGLNYIIIGDEMFLASDVTGVLDTESITDEESDVTDEESEVVEDATEVAEETTEV